MKRVEAGRTFAWKAAAAIVAMSLSTAVGCDAYTASKRERKEERKEERKRDKRATAARSPRDWARFPAVVEMTTDADVVGLGDVHGGYDRLVKLLLAARLIQGKTPGAYTWSGGKTVLVSVGDLIDKGNQSLPVLDLMMSLEGQAKAAGGAVIVTLGNHEAEFMAKSTNKKAEEGFDRELRDKGLDPSSVAGGDGPYGEWLANRPVAARVNSWFFAHGGNTSGLAVAEIARQYREALDGGRWGSSFLLGEDSILEAQKWWKGGDPAGNLTALGARHLVFGHDPGAFKQPGHIAEQFGGKLFLIDVGMSPAVDYSQGALLVVHRSGASEQASSLDPSGRRTSLWQGPFQ